MPLINVHTKRIGLRSSRCIICDEQKRITQTLPLRWMNIPNPSTYLPVYIQTLHSRTQTTWCFSHHSCSPWGSYVNCLRKSKYEHLRSLSFNKPFLLPSSSFSEEPFDMWYTGMLIAISYCTLDAECQDLSMQNIFFLLKRELDSVCLYVPREGWCHNVTIKKNSANAAIYLISNKGKILLIQLDQRSVWGPSHRTSRF